MKLRLGLTNDFLANIWNISAATYSSILNTLMKLFSSRINMSRVLAIKRTIQIYMPHAVRRKYLNLWCMLDCSETFIERPRDLKLQSATWSDYKHHNTLKYPVAVTPDGLISFIPQAWDGRATDRYITQQSGILDLKKTFCFHLENSLCHFSAQQTSDKVTRKLQMLTLWPPEPNLFGSQYNSA